MRLLRAGEHVIQSDGHLHYPHYFGHCELVARVTGSELRHSLCKEFNTNDRGQSVSGIGELGADIIDLSEIQVACWVSLLETIIKMFSSL